MAGLYQALVDWAFDERFRLMGEALARGGTLEQRLVAVLSAMFDFLRGHRGLMRIAFATIFAAPGELPAEIRYLEKSRRNYQLIEALIERGLVEGDLDCRLSRAALNLTNRAGDTLLHIALRYDRPQCIAWLCRQGVSVTVRNHAGQTSLALAWERENRAAVGCVLPPGASLPFRDALLRIATNTVAVFLRADPALAVARDATGRLAMEYAVRVHSVVEARQLLRAGSPLTPAAAVVLGRVAALPRLVGPLAAATRDQLLFTAARRASAIGPFKASPCPVNHGPVILKVPDASRPRSRWRRPWFRRSTTPGGRRCRRCAAL